MISSTFIARLILLVFAITQAVFSWSLRLLPRPIKSRLVSQTLAALIGAVLFSLIVSELFLYAAATGHVPLKNDKFFMTVFFTQQIIASIIVLNSDSVARRKEKALPKS
jgi:hypothetical protein